MELCFVFLYMSLSHGREGNARDLYRTSEAGEERGRGKHDSTSNASSYLDGSLGLTESGFNDQA